MQIGKKEVKVLLFGDDTVYITHPKHSTGDLLLKIITCSQVAVYRINLKNKNKSVTTLYTNNKCDQFVTLTSSPSYVKFDSYL